MSATRVSVIGAGSCGPDTTDAAYALGRGIAKQGHLLVCGGLGGVMEAACRGAVEAGGDTLGILPGIDRLDANPWVRTALATGLGAMRNYLVVLNGDIVVAVEGRAGTLSEIGLALKSGRTVVALGRYAGLDGVQPARDVDQALDMIQGHFQGSL